MKMKNIAATIGIAVIMLAGCSAHQRPEPAGAEPAKFKINASRFAGTDGCAIVYDSKAGTIAAIYGEDRCRQRFTACSTFKWPLAVMAFDAGILKDETTCLKWDGVRRSIDAWNRDQTAATWMKYSVVWYSQRLTPQLGMQRIEAYLDAFDYGNQNLSGGLSDSWLTPAKTDSNPNKGSLKISAFEQLEFLKKFWSGTLPVSPGAIDKTTRIVYLETSPGGFKLHGKTGSGETPQGGLGWFIGHVAGHGREYLFVISLTTDPKSTDTRYPGLIAKEIALGILQDNALR